MQQELSQISAVTRNLMEPYSNRNITLLDMKFTSSDLFKHLFF